MKYYYSIFCISALILSADAGEIDWDRASFGITVNYQVPMGDFGKYWNNSAGAGGVARYELTDKVYLMGSLTVGYFTPAGDTGDKNIPHVWLVNLTGSIHYEIPFSSRIAGIAGIGGDNFTFIFRGTPAKRMQENFIESEVALHGELGLSFRFPGFPGFDVFTRYSSIFSHPDQIPIWVSGVYVFL